MVITRTAGTMEYLTAEGIAVPHCFTTRFGGVSRGYLSSLNLGTSRGDDPANVLENFRRVGQVLGFAPEQLVLSRQVHSDTVHVAVPEDCGAGLLKAGLSPCDALVTNVPGIALAVFTADCTPILLHDPVTGAVGAVHAGWRGTVAAIAARTVETMTREYGTRPEDLRAAIGPNIGFCHFETDEDVPQAVLAAFGPEARRFIVQDGAKYRVDLKAVNAWVLRQAGVGHVEISTACTVCECDRYWSHRVTRGQRGAQGAIILCGGKQK